MIRRYYEEEMRYLREAGREFAHLHPEQAGLLDLDSVVDRDPYVERLFEGFAFLTGRVRERLDDELPEYTESLFRLLHPAFLKPFPAATILAFAVSNDANCSVPGHRFPTPNNQRDCGDLVDSS